MTAMCKRVYGTNRVSVWGVYVSMYVSLCDV